MARASPKMKANVKMLVEQRDRMLDQMDALKHKIEGLEMAISLLGREEGQPSDQDTSKRGNAKALLIEFLQEVGTTGLTSSSAVEIAQRRGIKLERGTAASNLSRMKADGIVAYDGDRYRLTALTRPRMVHASANMGTILGSGSATIAGGNTTISRGPAMAGVSATGVAGKIIKGS